MADNIDVAMLLLATDDTIEMVNSLLSVSNAILPSISLCGGDPREACANFVTLLQKYPHFRTYDDEVYAMSDIYTLLYLNGNDFYRWGHYIIQAFMDLKIYIRLPNYYLELNTYIGEDGIEYDAGLCTLENPFKQKSLFYILLICMTYSKFTHEDIELSVRFYKEIVNAFHSDGCEYQVMARDWVVPYGLACLVWIADPDEDDLQDALNGIDEGTVPHFVMEFEKKVALGVTHRVKFDTFVGIEKTVDIDDGHTNYELVFTNDDITLDIGFKSFTHHFSVFIENNGDNIKIIIGHSNAVVQVYYVQVVPSTLEELAYLFPDEWDLFVHSSNIISVSLALPESPIF